MASSQINWLHQEHLPDDLLQWAAEAAAIRRDIHAHPELGFETARTCGVIVDALRRFGIESVDDKAAKGGVIAVVEGSRPGKTIALRADMDALAMPDESGRPWASGVCRSHACGHDGHVAWMLLALRHLQAHRDFPGRVVALFQPAEEIGRGALEIIKSGVFEKYGISEVYGGHGDATKPAGVFGFCDGPMMASWDFFYITLSGRGVHAARPEAGIDPMPAAALLYESLQTIVSRKTSPFDTVVLSVAAVSAGTISQPNVIPNDVSMSGTVRTFSEARRDAVEREMHQMVDHIAAAQGCRGELKYDRITSIVDNDREENAFARRLAAELFGKDSVAEIHPSTGGEDFSEYQKKAPGIMFRVGIADADHQAMGHNTHYDFNDAVLPAAAYFLSELARRRLEALAAETAAA